MDLATEYKFAFDENNVNWRKDADLTELFIKSQQAYFNHRLHAVGYVFLNDILDALAINRIPEGQIVGWLLDDGDQIDWTWSMSFDDRTFAMHFTVQGSIYEQI